MIYNSHLKQNSKLKVLVYLDASIKSCALVHFEFECTCLDCLWFPTQRWWDHTLSCQMTRALFTSVTTGEWYGLLRLKPSATARVISRWWNDDEMSVSLVEETGAPRGNHRPLASNWQTLTHTICVQSQSRTWAAVVWLGLGFNDDDVLSKVWYFTDFTLLG